MRIMNLHRTFFITSVTSNRTPLFRNEARARLLLEILFDYREQGKYLLHEFVIMPDHIHLLITPAVEISLERAVQFIKGGYSYRLRKAEKVEVWQESFTNHRIRDAEDYAEHRSYIRLNPVRARLVANAREYPYSSVNAAFAVDYPPHGLEPALKESA
jgi:putative transposase